jgi:glycosyltransferase involved in cell wall biosynthesis
MVGMLNSCDRVLAVSEFVRRKFESMGVNAEAIRTRYIGCRLAADSQDPVSPTPGSPVRIAFVGYHNWFKGLPMLADSLELLTPEVLGRIDLTVLALNGQHMEAQLRRLEGRLAGLRLGFGYRHAELPRLLRGIDLGIVPSVWWDNAPQTVMEFLACGIPVLGADLGGIPEFVRDGENGLLFRGNDRWDLARRLAEVSRWPQKLAALRAGVRPPKTIGDHVTELELEYGNRLS